MRHFRWTYLILMVKKCVRRKTRNKNIYDYRRLFLLCDIKEKFVHKMKTIASDSMQDSEIFRLKIVVTYDDYILLIFFLFIGCAKKADHYLTYQ